MDRKEKLRKMLEEEKITQEEYEKLLESIPKEKKIETEDSEESNKSSSSFQSENVRQKIPWQTWCFIIILFLCGIVHFLMVGKYPQLGAAAILEIVLGFGLYYMKKWAYIILGVICILTMFANIFHGQIIALILNMVFLVILISAWKYYFEKTEHSTA